MKMAIELPKMVLSCKVLLEMKLNSTNRLSPFQCLFIPIHTYVSLLDSSIELRGSQDRDMPCICPCLYTSVVHNIGHSVCILYNIIICTEGKQVSH